MSGFDKLFEALEEVTTKAQEGIKDGIKKSAVLVQSKAQSKLGSYQPSANGYPAWQKLEPETVKRKHRTSKGKVSKAGKNYLKRHGSWGAGPAHNDDSPLVDRGLLRAAVTTDLSEIDRGNAYVGVATGSGDDMKGGPGSYAAAHEFGYAPKGIPPRPYLRPSLEESKEEIKKTMAESIKTRLTR